MQNRVRASSSITVIRIGRCGNDGFWLRSSGRVTSMVAVGQSPSLMSLYPSGRDGDDDVFVSLSA